MFTNRIPWVILLLVWMAGSTWWHVCKIKLLCGDSPAPLTASTVANNRGPALVVADGAQFRYAPPGNFSFAKSEAVASRAGIGSLLDSLTGYLKANPGKTLLVSGYYAPSEQNATSFASLGLARADGIKQLLQQQGLSPDRLITSGVKKDDLTFSAKGDSLYGGLAFTFGDPATTTAPATVSVAPVPTMTQPVTENELARQETFTSVFKPLNLYFPLGEAYFIQTESTTKFFSEATTYLARNKDKKLVLTGYTDNSGPDAVNLRLSRDRANSVKVRLRKSGIDVGQIQVLAKGEADPKADNNTLSGRKANRRVTVVVQ